MSVALLQCYCSRRDQQVPQNAPVSLESLAKRFDRETEYFDLKEGESIQGMEIIRDNKLDTTRYEPATC